MKFKINLEKHSLTYFFILSYLLMIIPTFIYLIGFFPETMLIIMIWSPTISGVVLSGLSGGWNQIKIFLSGFLKWKVSYKWYLAAFSLMLGPLIFAGFYLLLGGTAPGPIPGLTIPIILVNLLLTLIRGPLSEEAGWRGFALPRLESKYSALTSSLILGIIWACWHLPLYFIEPRMPFYIFIGLVIVITILMTWAYNNTNGSLIITILFHFSFNFNGAFITGLLGLLPTMVFYIGGGIMIGIYLIIVIWYTGPKKLSRSPRSEISMLN